MTEVPEADLTPGWMNDLASMIVAQKARRARSYLTNEQQDATDTINEMDALGCRVLIRDSLIEMWTCGFGD